MNIPIRIISNSKDAILGVLLFNFKKLKDGNKEN